MRLGCRPPPIFFCSYAPAPMCAYALTNTIISDCELRFITGMDFLGGSNLWEGWIGISDILDGEGFPDILSLLCFFPGWSIQLPRQLIVTQYTLEYPCLKIDVLVSYYIFGYPCLKIDVLVSYYILGYPCLKIDALISYYILGNPCLKIDALVNDLLLN